MSVVYNPERRKRKRSDNTNTPAMRTYLYLRSCRKGETEMGATRLREAFSVNGEATHERIGEQLLELQKEGLVRYKRLEYGGRVAYRIVLEQLPEELPENALLVPKSLKEDLTDAQLVAQLFMRLQDDKLGVITPFTVKDWQNCKWLLKTNSLAVVKGAVKRFWETKADQRKNPNFTEFKFCFARMANDAKDELEVENAIRVDEARKNRPEQTQREYLLQEIKHWRALPEKVARLRKELEALDAEEDEGN